MEILIIGNGFDLAHKLPTSYINFLELTKRFKDGDRLEFESNQLKEEFEKLVSTNIWLTYFIRMHELNALRGNNWIDFEQEIKDTIEPLEKSFIEHAQFRLTHIPSSYTIFSALIDSSPDLLRQLIPESRLSSTSFGSQIFAGVKAEKLIELFFQDLRNLTRAFEIYCIVFVNQSRKAYIKNILNGKPDLPLRKHDFDHVLSFNYTDTYRILYGSPRTRLCHIHGKAQIDSNKTNMILGTDDTLEDIYDTLNGNKARNHFAFAKFKKFFQRIFYTTGSEYRDWLKLISPHWHANIYIIGHSLGTTDHETLKEFFRLEDMTAKITIFYFDESAKINAIERVTEIIGRDELIRRVHGEDWSIRFVDQHDEKDGIINPITVNEENDTISCNIPTAS